MIGRTIPAEVDLADQADTPACRKIPIAPVGDDRQLNHTTVVQISDSRVGRVG